MPFRPGKRKKLRKKMVTPVRVRIAGAKPGKSHPAFTLDATDFGIKLGGIREEFKVGDIIEVQYRHERAMFRVIWVKSLEKSSEKHVGAECVEPGRNIWPVDFPAQPDEFEEPE